MQLHAGQIVVHPHHGPAKVMSFVSRKVNGTKRKYAKLRVPERDLEISVPVDMVSEVGVRDPMSAEELGALFDVLVAPSGQLDKTWSRRFKAQTELLNSGQMSKIATVARDVMRREEEGTISAGERSLLRNAMTPIVAELGVCLGMDEETASEAVRAAILQGTVPELGATLAPAV